jgi:hypothetical protein
VEKEYIHYKDIQIPFGQLASSALMVKRSSAEAMISVFDNGKLIVDKVVVSYHILIP